MNIHAHFFLPTYASAFTLHHTLSKIHNYKRSISNQHTDSFTNPYLLSLIGESHTHNDTTSSLFKNIKNELTPMGDAVTIDGDVPNNKKIDPTVTVRDNVNVNDTEIRPGYKLSYCNTICMIPPPEHAKDAWDALTKARIQLRDPGLYRWPPHANLLYPFVEFDFVKDSSDRKTDVINKYRMNDASCEEEVFVKDVVNEDHDFKNDNILTLLQNTASKCEPFQVTLNSLGCFGGEKRGVLWVYPYSMRDDTGSSIFNESNNNADDYHGHAVVNENEQEEPLVQLQKYLGEIIPKICDVRQNKITRSFTPHMTLSHYPSLDEAISAKKIVEQWWDKKLSFMVDKIYALRRVGDCGQFEIIATIPLGKKGAHLITTHDPPLKFPGMPLVEEDWVHEERMKLKQRRNWKGRRKMEVQIKKV